MAKNSNRCNERSNSSNNNNVRKKKENLVSPNSAEPQTVHIKFNMWVGNPAELGTDQKHGKCFISNARKLFG